MNINNYLAFIFLIVVALWIWGGIYVFRDTKNKSGRWGLNINPIKDWRLNPASILTEVKCPNCDYVLPRIRVPKSLKQILWGGWTCSNCGQETDKWGKARPEKRGHYSSRLD